MPANPRILLVDDEPNLVASLRYSLRESGFSIHACASAEDALDHLADHAVDVVLLDVNLPGMDGFAACPHIRRLTSAPVLMLSARGDEIDRIVGLEVGADDYVTKPFSVRELQARIKALLRRQQQLIEQLRGDREEVLTDGDLRLEVAGRELAIGGRMIKLRPKEFDLLEYLLRNRGRVISPELLICDVWGHQFTDDVHTVRVHVSSLRRKIEPDWRRPSRIETVRGSGYRYARA